MEDPNEPRRTALTYALLTLSARLVAAQSNVFCLWYGRRCYERSRGEMITMLYEKTLSRKLVPSANNDGKSRENETNDPVNLQPPQSKGKISGLRATLKSIFKHKKHVNPEKDLQKPASAGKILNLMRNDVYEVAQRFWEFRDLITIPLQIVVVIIILWKMLGWACLLGALTIIFAQLATAGLARILLKWERRRRSATDQRLQIASQFVESIRHLRWYGWQDEWQAKIIEKRQDELDLIWKTRIWQLWILLTSAISRAMFPVIAFFAFTALTKQPLRVDIAFPALSLFQMLDAGIQKIPNLITMLINAKVALDRIEQFMEEPDKLQRSEESDMSKPMKVEKAAFAWPGSSNPVLQKISLSISPGMTVIGGKVGAGKTALLLGLLGELDLIHGSIDHGAGAVGYCEQRPWLQSMSIRENILFHTSYNEGRYKQVLEACMLIPDLASFKYGDLSHIGENGVGLSGGQKARVALARAVYSPARVLMLDDPLSSLDHQTAESIVQKCFAGPLLKDRTLVLVTHRLDLCRHVASQYIEIADGAARTRPVTDLPTIPSTDPIQPPSTTNENVDKQLEDDAVPDKFIEDEHRAHGGIPMAIYWMYIKAGRLIWWAALVIVLLLFRFFGIARQWFVKEWGEAYERPGFFDQWPSPLVNVNPWVLGFLVVSIIHALLRVLAEATLIIVAYFASQELFKGAIQRVAHSTFRFYDVTPVGRLMNRITSDMGMIDGNISTQFHVLALLVVVWASSLGVLASIAPLFLLIAVFLVAGFVVIFMHFLPTSQSLRRLETTSLSPLISDFGALVDGLTTVRAFCAQYQFQSRVIAVTDEFQRMDHFYWSLQAWLMYRIDIMSAIVIFLLTIMGLYSGISPGLIAFALLNAAQFVVATHEICRIYGQLQMDFVSVERIAELVRLEQEPPGDIFPSAAWPSYGGDIVFDHVTVRYADHLDPALVDLSFRIKGGSTTAIVGRTGSGKSTLAAALLATVTPEAGTITIDGVDIARVDKQALRSRVTFLAQDPVLFPGTIHQNLDPMREHSDEDCERVLSKVGRSYGWSLETQVDSNGRNFSQGQRQLIGLARAILRRSAIVILDEVRGCELHWGNANRNRRRHPLTW
jgi:ABC-type multidrug transport system fused ATPase/permease subunit